MTRKQYRFWVTDEKLKEFLDSKGNIQTQDFSEYAREIFTLIMENKLDPNTISDLQKQKLLADIDYKKVSTEFMRAKLKYTYNFDSLPSKAGSHALKQRVENSEMGAVKSISFYDEKNYRFQCPECGILFAFVSLADRVQKKSQFIDHFMQTHRIFNQTEQEELKHY